MILQITSDRFFTSAVGFGSVQRIDPVLTGKIKNGYDFIAMHLPISVGDSVGHAELGSANGKLTRFFIH